MAKTYVLLPFQNGRTMSSGICRPQMGLEIPWRLVFYKYFAPLALAAQSYLFFASILAKRLSMLLKGKFTFPLGCRI
jgi:hypothetical protein